MTRVLKFVAQVHQYQLAYKIPLPLATLIAEKPRRQIMARNKGLTLTKFFDLKTKKLIKLLMKEVRPESPLIFLKVVDKSVTFELPHAYRPSASEFLPLYNALLMYRNDFTMIVDVLSEKNSANIPPVTNKEGGLIHLFLKKIPYDYGKHVMQTMKLGRFRNIHDFLRPFYKVVEQHKDDFTRTKSMNQFFSASLLMDAQPQASRRPSGFVKRHHVNEIAAVQEIFSDGDSEKSTESHHEDDVPDALIPVESENSPPSAEDSESSHHTESDAEDRLQHLDNIVKAPMRVLQRPSAAPSKEPYKPPFKRDRETVCWVELFEGNCLNKNCPHSHDYAVLRKAHQQYSEKLQNSKYRLKPDAQRKVGTFNMIEIPVEDSRINELMTNKLLHDVPESAIMNAVHHEGTISTMNGSLIQVYDALFDSGALSGSFLDRNFVRSHQDELNPFRFRVHSRVKLADNETIIEIDEAYTLPVTFSNARGEHFTATVTFYVLPECNHQMIIGLPAILKHFSSLHTQMIETVVADINRPSPVYPNDVLRHLNSIEPGSVRYPWTYVQEEEAPEDAASFAVFVH